MKHPYIASLLFCLCACTKPPVVAPVADVSGLTLSGHGVAYLPDGSFYDGEFQQGLFHGKGSLVWKNGSRYEGDFHQGHMHGTGILSLPMGATYTGEFANGMFEGQGEYSQDRGYRYKGSFVLGEFDGHGSMLTQEGQHFEGEFHHGKPDGQVKVAYDKETTYSGGMKNWRFQGNGTYTIKNVSYSGKFVDGKMEGKGVITRESGRYEGEIKNWMEHGQGEWRDDKGNEYAGMFDSGSFNGVGSYKSKNGDGYRGEFKNGLYHGVGEMNNGSSNGHKKLLRGYWEYGQYTGQKKEENKSKVEEPAYVIEEVLFNQSALLQSSLKKLKYHQPEKTDLYFIAFSPYGTQDVFMNEAQLSASLFDDHYHTAGRSLMLINNKKTLDTVPMATRYNLRASLNHIANLIDKDKDILFLYLSGHGSKKQELTATLRGVKLVDLTAAELKKIFEESKVKWKVVVVSACYSGGYIDYLKDPYTMVITAASSDHVSFGCSDEAELTYFGRAFFKEALPESASFSEAFTKAKELVTQWENREGYSNSNPTIYIGTEIEKKLLEWKNGESMAPRSQ